MKAIILNQSDSVASIVRRTFLIYSALSVTSFIYAFLNGLPSLELIFIPMMWMWSATYGVILDLGTRLCVPPRRSLVYRSLIYAPIPVQIGQDLTRILAYRALHDVGRYVYMLLWLLDVCLLLIGVLLLRSAYESRVKDPASPAALPVVPTTPVDDIPAPSAAITSPLLGQNNDFIARVIHTVLSRSARSERAANFSLTVMLVLVMVGGMASFGLWAFTHADRISTLEKEHGNLIKLQKEMREVQEKLGGDREEVALRLNNLYNFIEQNYSTSANYEATLNSLKLQSQSNYADIAIRVTIAVLTIFLVQVFFSVYKYNHHHANMLAAKAEALELAGNDTDARKELSREAVSIVKESVPSFSPYPRTPIEEAIMMAEKLKKSG
jgi:hypothetical protein